MIIQRNVTDCPEIFKRYFANYELLYNESMTRMGIRSNCEFFENGFLLFFEDDHDLETAVNMMQIHIPTDDLESENEQSMIWTSDFIEYPSDTSLKRIMKAVVRRYRKTPIKFEQLTESSYRIVYPSIGVYEAMFQQELQAMDSFVRNSTGISPPPEE